MAYEPVSGVVPQFSRNAGGASASGYYLKGYSAGTTTPLSMGTDGTPTSTLAKCALNSRGEPISNDADETTVFIPHFNATYMLALYTNATDADNNTTANAVWTVDNISGQFDASTIDYRSNTTVTQFLDRIPVASYSALRAIDSSTVDDGDYIWVEGNEWPLQVKTGSVTDGGKFFVFNDDSNRYAEVVASTYDDYSDMRAVDSSILIDGLTLNLSGDSNAGEFVVKTGTVTDDGLDFIVFSDDSNRYAERLYRIKHRNYLDADMADRYLAMFEAQAIRDGAGIPNGITVGVRSGKAPGLTSSGANQARLTISSDASASAASDSGTGTESDPYVIQDRDIVNAEATGSLYGFNWDDGAATYYINLVNCRIANFSGGQVRANTPTKLKLVNCRVYGGSGSGNLTLIGGGGTIEHDQTLFGGGGRGCFTNSGDATGTERIVIYDSEFSDDDTVWSGGLSSRPSGVTGENDPAFISIKHCDFTSPTMDTALIPYGNVGEWEFLNNDVGSGIRGFYSLQNGVGRNGTVRYSSFSDKGSNLTGQEDLDIGYCEFNDSPDGERVLRFLSDGGPCKRVNVHHCKFTKTTGTNVAGNEVLESLPNNNADLNEDITFEYNWVTECVEDAYEFVGTINGICRHCVADNCAGQIVDYFTDPTNNLPCVGGDVNHIYGDCSDVGVILTDVQSVNVSGHIYIDNTAAVGLPVVALQALSNPNTLPDYCSIMGPISLPSSSATSSPFATISGTPGPNNTAVWLENNQLVTFGIDVSGNFVIR